jgi:hypothetical protein
MPIHYAAQNASNDSGNENAVTELAAELSLHPISSFAARGAGAGGGAAACRPATTRFARKQAQHIRIRLQGLLPFFHPSQ